MSILAAMLLVGVAYAKYIVPHDNDAVLQPIASTSQVRRICAELCMSGLGGEPCGESCLDIVPQGLPIQSPRNASEEGSSSSSAQHQQRERTTTRRDACSVLCPNRLGYPLCQCEETSADKVDSRFKVDFVQICSYFCLKHNYKVYGCQQCRLYQEAEEEYGGTAGDVFGLSDRRMLNRQGVDWEKWCKTQCINGDGGVACNCDILPLRARVK